MINEPYTIFILLALFYSAGIVTVWYLAEQNGLAQGMPTLIAEGRDRQISCPDSQVIKLPRQRLYCVVPVFVSLATSLRLMRTLVNPLYRPKKLISKHIHTVSRPILPSVQGLSQTCRGSQPGTLNTVAQLLDADVLKLISSYAACAFELLLTPDWF